jgi:hypothetical protein
MSEEPVLQGRLFDLALAYMKRSDEAANYQRALILAVALAGVALVGNVLSKTANATTPFSFSTSTILHIVALACFFLSAIMTFMSWGRQKKKAGRRFELLTDRSRRTLEFPKQPLLHDDPLAALQAYNEEIRNGSPANRNHEIDRVSLCILVAGIVAGLFAWIVPL